VISRERGNEDDVVTTTIPSTNKNCHA
jgi:hypothetical protein